LSCRALGRDLELAFVSYCLSILGETWEVECFTAEYLATEKNRQVVDFWDRVGFTRTRETPGHVRYTLFPSDWRESRIGYVRIVQGSA
jgi:predicted enzyme involved in methoxymalonyl-ACP biosynthesis